MSEELEVTNKASQCTDLQPADVTRQIQKIQHMMKECMKEGPDGHFGTIPGCGNKPTLFKSGAEKLSMMFQLSPSYDVSRSDYPNGHREYEIVCTITHIPTGNVRAQGVGACSTMEGKYKYRQAEKKVIPLDGQSIPEDYKKNKANYAKQGLGARKVNEVWAWCRLEGSGDKVEHDNPADYWNTCLKMAKKRAYVDAMLSATAASDIFTQDIEDMPEVIPAVNNHQQAPQQQPEEPRANPLQEQAMDLFDSVKGQLSPEFRQWCMDGISNQFRNYQGVIDEIGKWQASQGGNNA
jgi:hypothetical protein